MADILDENKQVEDLDLAQRPKSLSDFTGQKQLSKHLATYIKAARGRGEPLDHTLLFGPPGLGKTTLSEILANEMGFSFIQATGPGIKRPADLAAILCSMENNSCLFLDEIHRLDKKSCEMLYTAMEDRRIDIMIGEGDAMKIASIRLPIFTLIGATTRPGMLPGPLRDRFGIQGRLEPYEDAELAKILERSATLSGIEFDSKAIFLIAQRSRGIPRVAKRILRRVRDFAENEKLNEEVVLKSLKELDIDVDGLNPLDLKYLTVLERTYRGGPAGLKAISASMDEDPDLLEDGIETLLLARGLIKRTPQGRMITDAGKLRINGKIKPNAKQDILELDIFKTS